MVTGSNSVKSGHYIGIIGEPVEASLAAEVLLRTSPDLWVCDGSEVMYQYLGVELDEHLCPTLESREAFLAAIQHLPLEFLVNDQIRAAPLRSGIGVDRADQITADWENASGWMHWSGAVSGLVYVPSWANERMIQAEIDQVNSTWPDLRIRMCDPSEVVYNEDSWACRAISWAGVVQAMYKLVPGWPRTF